MFQLRLSSALALASAALFAACAPSISSERDANIPVPQGATWAWAGTGAASSGDSAARGRYIPARYAYAPLDPIVRQRLVRAVDGAMRERGFRRQGDTAQADFLLSFSFDGRSAYARAATVAPAFGVGLYGGWGGRPWGFYRPWGYSRPWGWGWSPWRWGFGFAAVPMFGYYGAPAYGYGGGGYRESVLVVQLRMRSDGEVAWIGRYRTDAHDLRGMSDAQLQEAVNKLFSTLR